MPVKNRLADLQGEIAAWRRDIHAHPELGFEVRRTAALAPRASAIAASIAASQIQRGLG